MKSKFYLGLMALAALSMSSCSKDQVVSQAPEANNAITFDTYAGRPAQTKAVPTDNESIKNGFDVYGYWTEGEIAFADGTPTSEFMQRTKVTFEDRNWTYKPEKYWPAEGKVSFYAYAPAGDLAGNAISGNENLLTGTPIITYNLQTDVNNQVDLVWAAAPNKAKNTEAATPAVKLIFKHALSKVNVSAKTDLDPTGIEIIITDLKLSANLLSTAKVDLTKGAVTSDNSAELIEFNLKNHLTGVALVNEAANILENEEKTTDMYLIPNGVDPNLNLNVTYTIKMGNFKKEYTAVAPVVLDGGFVQAKAYNIVLTINGNGQGEDFEPITFGDITVEDWEAATEHGTTIGEKNEELSKD